MTARCGALATMTLLACLATACTPSIHVAHVRSGPALMPRPTDAPIPVFFNERPSAPYREIGQIRVRSQGSSASVETVLAAAVEEARSLGADALIVDLRAHYASVPVTTDCEGRPTIASTDRLNARATAIIFLPHDGPDRPEPTPTGPPPRPGCVR